MRKQVGPGADIPAEERAEVRPSANSFLMLQASAGNAAVGRLVEQTDAGLVAPEFFVQRQQKATAASVGPHGGN